MNLRLNHYIRRLPSDVIFVNVLRHIQCTICAGHFLYVTTCIHVFYLCKLVLLFIYHAK